VNLPLLIALSTLTAGSALAETGSAKPGPIQPPPEEQVSAVTPQSFCDELARAARNRKAEGDKVAAERSRLEKLLSEITRAREALKNETEQLEQLLKQADGRQGKSASKPDERAAAKAGREAQSDPPRVDMVAKSMRGLKPEQAAEVLKKLDHDLAARVLAQMRPADAAAALGKLDAGDAAKLLTDASRLKSP
jgi:flagellar motility protein MotE (MotC chaperone)